MVPMMSWARALHVLEYWMQCPHKKEWNWTSQAEDELLTAGFRLLLLRITSGSSTMDSRAAVHRDAGTSCQRAGEFLLKTSTETRGEMRAAAR